MLALFGRQWARFQSWAGILPASRMDIAGRRTRPRGSSSRGSKIARMAKVADSSGRSADPRRYWNDSLNPRQRSFSLFESPADLVAAIPITRTYRKVRWHVAVSPPEGGLVSDRFAQCENVRCFSKQRLKRWRGRVSEHTMQKVEDRLRILLGLCGSSRPIISR